MVENLKHTNGSEELARAKKEQQERLYKNRIQRNFSYGRDPVNYTSDARSNLQPKDLAQCKESESQRIANGKLTRKTQFLFGTDEFDDGLMKP